MLTKATRPERILLSPAFSIGLALCAAAVMALWGGVENWLAIPLSILLGAVASVRVRARSLFKGPTFTVLSTFMLLQAASAQSVNGCLLACFALATTIILFFCFMQPDVTRLFFLLFLANGAIAVFRPQWLMWAVVMLSVMISIRAFSMRGLVAALLGLITAYIIIPVWSAAFSADPISVLEHFLQPYAEAVFVPVQILSEAFMFSAAACILLSLMTFLTAYGYPVQARSLNMAIFVISLGAIVFPLITVGGDMLWLPLLNLCTAYHAAHLIASNRGGWIFAVIIWVVITLFIIKQLCGL